VNPSILNLDDRVVFFPVRHHSPTAARLAADLIRKIRPSAVLIEGPSDFNERIDELFLPHTLPIAIYTYFRTASKQLGAFYPFCIYSPEWQAAQTGHHVGASVSFIDMPCHEMRNIESRQHLYSDGELRENAFISLACKRLGLEGFDELWDDMIEAPAVMTLPEYMTRCHHLCYHMRQTRTRVDKVDMTREAFMADKILATMSERRVAFLWSRVAFTAMLSSSGCTVYIRRTMVQAMSLMMVMMSKDQAKIRLSNQELH
jgi:hypothetical protein